MSKFIPMFVMAFIGSLIIIEPSSALAQDAAAAPNWGTGVGAGLAVFGAVLGAGLGIGSIGSNACEATARQPEMAGRIFVNMILTAALIEGVALFGAVIGFLMAQG